MNPDTQEETNGRIKRQERTSRQHECLQARAGSYSEAARGRHSDEHEESVRQQILEGLIADKGGGEKIATATSKVIHRGMSTSV
jgi:hypothetical protein